MALCLGTLLLTEMAKSTFVSVSTVKLSLVAISEHCSKNTFASVVFVTSPKLKIVSGGLCKLVCPICGVLAMLALCILGLV